MREYNDITQNVTELHFNGMVETKEVVFLWDNEKLKNVEVGTTYEGQFFSYGITYEIIEDGRVGRCIFRFTCPQYTEDKPQKVGKAHFYFTNDKSYRQDMYVDIKQDSTYTNDKFVTFTQSTIVVPSQMTQGVINYATYGGAQVTDVEFLREQGVYGTFSDGRIDWLTQFDGLTFGNERTRTVPMKVTYTHPDGSIHYETIQVIFLLPYLTPIWKDIDASYLTNKDSVIYEIIELPRYAGSMDNVIYRGKAYRMPEENRIRFNINKVCENYLSQNIDMDYLGIDGQYGYGKTFRIMVDGQILCEYIFYNSWTNDPKERIFVWKMTQNVSNSIDYEIIRGQIFTCSLWTPCLPTEASVLRPLLQESPDNTTGSYTPVEGYDDYVYPFDYTNITFDTKKLKPDTKYLLCGMQTYKIVDCPKVKWVIHYLNSKGGYCTYAVRGNVNITSKAKSHSMNKTFSNTTSAFEVKKYLNETIERFEVTLPMLSKREASMIDEIIQSTEVWLERIDNNRMFPVIVDTDITDFKNNQKVRNYTIPFIASQQRLRK